MVASICLSSADAEEKCARRDARTCAGSAPRDLEGEARAANHARTDADAAACRSSALDGFAAAAASYAAS